jgi:hypothetical protein
MKILIFALAYIGVSIMFGFALSEAIWIKHLYKTNLVIYTILVAVFVVGGLGSYYMCSKSNNQDQTNDGGTQ